jgi:hypothetical protein
MVTSDDGFGATIDAPKEPHKKEPFKAQISLDWGVLEQAEATDNRWTKGVALPLGDAPRAVLAAAAATVWMNEADAIEHEEAQDAAPVWMSEADAIEHEEKQAVAPVWMNEADAIELEEAQDAAPVWMNEADAIELEEARDAAPVWMNEADALELEDADDSEEEDAYALDRMGLPGEEIMRMRPSRWGVTALEMTNYAMKLTEEQVNEVIRSGEPPEAHCGRFGGPQALAVDVVRVLAGLDDSVDDFFDMSYDDGPLSDPVLFARHFANLSEIEKDATRTARL